VTTFGNQLVPDGFLIISEAVNRLANGMWGGRPRPVPVQKIKAKREYKRGSIGFGPWRDVAAECFRAAALKGDLVICVTASRQRKLKVRCARHRPPPDLHPLPVPTSVLQRLLRSRGGLPDHPIRPTLKTADGKETLLALLTSGLLVVRKREFLGWYREERAKHKWASQKAAIGRGRGRPTKRTKRFKNAVLTLVRDGAWSAKDTFTKLRRLLLARGHSDAPSVDTLARLVRDLHRETGIPELFRRPRVRRSRI
jgi:hypothetical protein